MHHIVVPQIIFIYTTKKKKKKNDTKVYLRRYSIFIGFRELKNNATSHQKLAQFSLAAECEDIDSSLLFFGRQKHSDS